MDFGFIKQVFPLYVHAAILTLKIGILGIILAIAVGLLCTLILHKKIPVLRQLVSIYIELSRNTPLLIQLFFIYFTFFIKILKINYYKPIDKKGL